MKSNVNVISRLEFELAVYHFSYNTHGGLPRMLKDMNDKKKKKEKRKAKL